jgi:hypothetical protein
MSGASLASFAIRSRFLETVFGLGIPSIFPSSGSVLPAAPSLHRVPRVGSPASQVLLAAPTSRPPSRCASVAPRAPIPSASTEASGSPRFLGSPLAFVPPSQTPVGRSTLALTSGPVLPSGIATPSAPHLSLSRLHHAAQMLAVYASQPGSPQDHARLAADPLARLWPGGTLTRWTPLSSFRSASDLPSSRARLHLAHRDQLRCRSSRLPSRSFMRGMLPRPAQDAGRGPPASTSERTRPPMMSPAPPSATLRPGALLAPPAPA